MAGRQCDIAVLGDERLKFDTGNEQDGIVRC